MKNRIKDGTTEGFEMAVAVGDPSSSIEEQIARQRTDLAAAKIHLRRAHQDKVESERLYESAKEQHQAEKEALEYLVSQLVDTASGEIDEPIESIQEQS